jgi:CDP-glycerol glycerophosphotransferase (TagB/SpsB family)
MKAIEFGITKGDLAKRYVERDIRDTFFHPAPFRRPDYMVSTTDFFDGVFSQSFRISKEQCIQTGCPRNMLLNKPLTEVGAFIQKHESAATKQLVAHIQQYNTVLVYMPTWRDSQRECFANGFDLNALNACAAKQNACVLMKPHANTIIDKSIEYSNLIFLDGNVDMYCILPYTHVLITDYSSILYDYILMPEKHVILFHYDFEEYVNSREFIFDIQDNIVGRKVYTFDELLEVITNADYSISQNDLQRILTKFWGKTTEIDSCHSILENLKFIS